MKASATLSFNPGGVLVAGGSGGIGEGIARRFAAAGVPVLITYHRSEAKARAVKTAIEDDGGRCDYAQTDLAEPLQVERLFAQARTILGRIAHVVYAAGPSFDFNFIGAIPLDEKLDEKTRESIRKQTIPLQRFGTAADIRWATLFLCSQQAAFITGQTLAVDGGAQI